MDPWCLYGYALIDAWQWKLRSNERRYGRTRTDERTRSNGWWGHHKISTRPTNRPKRHCCRRVRLRRHKWWRLVSQVWRTDIFPRRFADISRRRDSEKCEGRKIDGGEGPLRPKAAAKCRFYPAYKSLESASFIFLLTAQNFFKKFFNILSRSLALSPMPYTGMYFFCFS